MTSMFFLFPLATYRYSIAEALAIAAACLLVAQGMIPQTKKKKKKKVDSYRTGIYIYTGIAMTGDRVPANKSAATT